jgi:hypothetical protein
MVTDSTNITLINIKGLRKTFRSVDVKFRFPSEHTFNGIQFDGEIQINYVVRYVILYFVEDRSDIMQIYCLDRSEICRIVNFPLEGQYRG